MPTAKQNWYRGNLHTHTTNSDGDSSPEEVARWYQEHGYHFLALTDHDYLTHPIQLAQSVGKEHFLLLAGEELTAGHQGHPIHLNAFGLKKATRPAFGTSPGQTIQRNVELIRRQGALPSLNHPYWGQGISPEEIATVRGLKLFEIYNGNHPDGPAIPGNLAPAEQTWDRALSLGAELYAIAADDAHHFHTFAADLANPGRGWVQISANRLDEPSLLAALEAGDFYASTGIELEQVERRSGHLRLKLLQQTHESYEIRFLGKDGKLLLQTEQNPAEYRLQSGEPYVRATVVDSSGRQAWVQPVWNS